MICSWEDKDIIEACEQQITDLGKECEELESKYIHLQDRYIKLQRDYIKLQQEHIQLINNYKQTLTPRNPEDAYREDFTNQLFDLL